MCAAVRKKTLPMRAIIPQQALPAMCFERGRQSSRAIEAIPDSLREDDKMKGLVIGIEATQRELEKVFKQNGIERIASMGMPLDPNQHQAMMEIPTAMTMSRAQWFRKCRQAG